MGALIKELEEARITAIPDALTFDPTKIKQGETALDLAVTLKGGTTGYREVGKPDKVTITRVGQTDTFKIAVASDFAKDGEIIFIDSSRPPLTVEVPIKKK